MIGLVIVTHGALAREFVSALEHVVGPQDRLETVCIRPDDNMEIRLVKLSGVRKTSRLADAVVEAQNAGRKYIKLASNLLDEPGA